MVGGPCSVSPCAGSTPGTGPVAPETPGTPLSCRASPRTGPGTVSSTGALLHVAPGRGRAVIAEVGAWPAGKRLPSRPRKWRSRERLQFRASVSAYQPSCAERTTDSPGASRPARHRYVNVTLPPMPGAKPQSAADSVLELGRLGQPETSPKSSRPPASGPFLLA